MKQLLCFLVLLLVAFPISAWGDTPPHYVLTELPGPANAISDTGFIVGTAGEQGYRWRAGKEELFPQMAQAFGVNNAGDVVGTYRGERWEAFSALLLTANGVQLFPPHSSTSWAAAFAVNDAGLVAGIHYDTRPFPRVWGEGSFRLPDYRVGEARAVTSQGWIAGWSGNTYDWLFREGDRPMLWKFDKTVVLPLPPTATGAHLMAISDTGIVGGVYWRAVGFENGEPQPYLMDLWTGKATIFPQLSNGVIRGINDAGVAVGEIAGTRPGIFLQDGNVYRMDRLVVGPGEMILSRATDIDNAGRIVGWGIKDGKEVGFLLTPVGGRYQ